MTTAHFDIPVRLFGRHRELIGHAEVSVRLFVGATVGDVRVALAGHPALRDSLAGSALALNRRYEADDAPVDPGDEVAIIPPVAGG